MANSGPECGYSSFPPCTESEEAKKLSIESALMFPALVLIGCIIFFFYGLFTDNIPTKIRNCIQCEQDVDISEILNLMTYEVLGVSDSTQAITTNNQIVGLTSTGSRINPTLGNIQTTSHVPVKIGRVKFTTQCPSCKNQFQWINDVSLTQWTTAEGNIIHEIQGPVELP